MNELWKISLLGSLKAERGDHAAGPHVITRFKTQKVASLLAYLAYHLRQAHPREVLIEMLWPDSDAPTLRNSLSVALSTLRNQFEPPGVPQGTVLRADRFSVGLNPAAVTTDVAQFERAVKAAGKADSSVERVQYLMEAVELYQGPLLPGFYDEWIRSEQERFAGLFFDVADALIAYQEQVGDSTAALSHARHTVAIDPLREEGQRNLIRLLSAVGQPGAALRQYKEYERLLEAETGEEPSPALRALFRQIEKATGLSVPVLVPPPAAPRSPVSSLSPPAAASVPAAATVTFLMTDIKGGTRLSQRMPEHYGIARERHHLLLHAAFSRHGGQEVRETGEGFVVAFPTVRSALACAAAAQQALAEQDWPQGSGSLQVRMALHTGDVEPAGEETQQYPGTVFHYATRMLSAAHGGQVLVSEATAALAPGGGGESGIRLVALGVFRLGNTSDARRLFQAEYPGMPRTDFGPLAAEAGHRANLPLRFNRFFGREQEIEQLRHMLLLSDVRLVTLTGPGGNGKTRLALEVADRIVEAFAGAVYFVPLAALSDSALIAGAILDSLSAPRTPQTDLLEQAVEALSRKRTLLVLDNLEHLIARDGTELVHTLLTRVPSLTLLVTSRQLLGLSAERAFALPPLPVPGGEEGPERLSVFDSVQLFIDRAQQVIPYFQVSNANAAAVAALVTGLEGIPLAIELAAARIQVLTPSQMLAQLGNRFDFLATRRRDAPERQRTLRGTLEWSYQLLSPEMRRFFARLSVFRGGWTVEAAEAVCEEPLALDYLEQLRECSLVQSDAAVAAADGADAADALRFRMLETLREYGQEQLTQTREMDPVRLRHLAYFLQSGQEAVSLLTRSELVQGYTLLEQDYDNLSAALEFWLEAPFFRAEATGEANKQEGLRLASALQWFWQARGHWKEGRERMTAVLSHPRSQNRTQERAETLNGIGLLAWPQNDYTTARQYYEESLAIREEIGDRNGVAGSLNNLGTLAAEQGDFETAHSLFERSLAVNRELGNRVWEGNNLLNLGCLAVDQGDYQTAERYLEESLRLGRDIGHLFIVAGSLLALGGCAESQGEPAKAKPYFTEALDLWRTLGAKEGLSATLGHLGNLARREKDFATARSLLSECLSLCRDAGSQRIAAQGLEGLGHLAHDEAKAAEAVRHFGAADALREKTGTPQSAGDREDSARTLAALRAVLGDDGFAREWAAGRAMDWEQAAANALEPREQTMN
jgi:predicted ATPase/DNA-binding SARP family transcriptional activator/class 3 adenylate cyclase/uncharacterized protein HemY